MLAITILSVANPLQAQGIDPTVLQRLQRDLGSSGGNRSDALDQSRTTNQPVEQRPDLFTGAQTPEEIEARRRQASLIAAEFYEPSRIEAEYRQRTSDKTLRQFGYDLFQATQALSGPVTGELGDNYVLGIGDEVVVNFQGATNDSRTVRVNREGQIIVGDLPPVRAAGRSLGSVRSQLADQTRQTMLGTNVYVSVGSVRAITVFVGGEVNRPGQHSLTSLADVASALARAEGVRPTGSLRRVRVVRGSQTISVDLYGLLGIGTPTAVRLQDGDRVIVPAIGDTVAITGGVTRPGIYELRGDNSVDQILGYAGGPLRARGSRVTISRIGADGVEAFIPVTGTAQTVHGSDVVQVIAGSSGVANRVQLRGNTDSPGPRPLQAAATVRDLVGDLRDLRPNTYIPFAVLERFNARTGARDYLGVNLASALTTQPVALEAEDTLYVLNDEDVAFLNSASVRQTALGQQPSLQCQSLREFANVVRDTQQVRFNVITRGSFVVDRGGVAQVVSAGGSLQSIGSRTASELAPTASDPALLQAQPTMLNGQQALPNGQQPIAGVDRYNVPNPREEEERRELSQCPQLFEDYPQLLPVVIEHATGIGGAVRRPGAYPVTGAITADDAMSIAGGVIANSSDVIVEVNRGNAGTTERYPLDTANLALTRISLGSGDDIRFNAARPQFESGAVLLTGEFRRPGLYTIRRGETLSSLVRRAGGVSSVAYPYGAVFTRQSVKQLQEEGFRRTARDLTSGLVATSVRKQNGAQGLGEAAALVQTLARTEAAGRMVVEADPDTLGQRPDLDTILEPGDAIYMPKQPNFVIVLGDVNNPGAVQFVDGKSAEAYIADAGGRQRTGDKGRTYVVLPNGLAQPIKSSAWRQTALAVPPGSTVIMPKNLDPLLGLDLARDITGIVGGLLSSVATVAILARNRN